jgi:lipoate-protein ligase A
MDDWRLLRLETHNAFVNMAVDEAILRFRMDNLVPNTVRFYRWKPSAVSIGKFQNIQKEVHVDNCKKNGVDVVRRITGGGTVYHDAQDEITYSVVASKQDLEAENVTAAYARIYEGIAEALKILGIKTDFGQGDARKCPNLTVNGKKISGSAQSHKKGIVLQHGTLLLDINLERMFTFLRVPWAESCMEIVNIAKHKHTSIKHETQRNMTLDEAEKALIEGFQKALNIKLDQRKLTPYEHQLAERLGKEKYATSDWNLYGRTSVGE